MPRIALVARRPHRYAGRLLAPGEVFYARGQDDARVLKAIGAAVDAPKLPPLPPAPPPPPSTAPVVVEPEPAIVFDEPAPDQTPEPLPAAEPSDAPTEGEGRRRRYRRRDLEAEDTA